MAKPILKTPAELDSMRRAGSIAMAVLRRAVAAVTPGVTTGELDRLVGETIRSHGAASAFRGYRDFPAECCISVNEGVIHGIGDSRRLQFGDLVKIDIGVRHEGFVGDLAMTVPCGGCSPLGQKLMDVTIQALREGIGYARAGNSTNDVGRAVQKVVEAAGFGVVREFCGHGVGRGVHEEPQVPNYFDRRGGTKLRAGMTIAIEPMVTVGNPAVKLLDDQWTVVTQDRQLAAHFEHTVLVTDGEPEILTSDNLPPLY
ncbi:MAG: type I methionyl aminopeptidase [Verrucomicrobia bacterium]|nr:MAG: type I methionyl aminopeptidase [Verrucomicrobiota bacterium]